MQKSTKKSPPKKSAADNIFCEKTVPQAKIIKENATHARFLLTES